jgi:2-amino-4-hydroxy-6-hydroxymethyldihydropteridine diphosphokinase
VTRVYVSVGSNQKAHYHIPKALETISSLFSPVDISPVYESVAVGFDGDNFLNLVVGFDTELSLDELNSVLGEIEKSCGRVRGKQRFMSRTMDLDLLLYGDLICHDDEWDIPRQEIICNAFVLKPLSDLAPNDIHPELHQTYSQLWKQGDFSDQKLWLVEL